jgi:hypothetical protein
MTWTRERLESEWIGGPIEALGARGSTAITAFDCIEKHLGTAWLEACRLNGLGTAPTLGLVLLGECLGAIETLPGFGVLVQKIRNSDASTWAELEAVWMFRRIGDVEIELAPDLAVSAAVKKPDFRVRRASERWTYVEVTRPEVSDEAVAAQELLRRLHEVAAVRRAFSMEIFLRREPTASEEGTLLAHAFTYANSDEFGTVDIPGLAILTKDPFTAPVVTRHAHPNEDDELPRIGTACGVVGGNGSEPQRIVSVRMPFSDERGDAFLKREAKQLSKDEQGLIMIDMTVTRIGMQIWEGILRTRLQPNLHTRVGGICLFAKGTERGPNGIEVLFDLRTMENPHAVQPLPPWILAGLASLAAADDAKRAVPRSKPKT